MIKFGTFPHECKGDGCAICHWQLRTEDQRALTRSVEPVTPPSSVSTRQTSGVRSRQLQWKDRMKAAGKCVQCGEPRDPQSKALCASCLETQRTYQRARCGHQPWTKGGPGRPPITASSQAE